MYYTLLILQCVLALAITALVLLQPTEGGALGIGESAGLLKGQPVVNPLVRVTVVVGGLFFVTCLAVSVAQSWIRPGLLGQQEEEIYLPNLPSVLPSQEEDFLSKPSSGFPLYKNDNKNGILEKGLLIPSPFEETP